jgi:hypothetical protein
MLVEQGVHRQQGLGNLGACRIVLIRGERDGRQNSDDSGNDHHFDQRETVI